MEAGNEQGEDKTGGFVFSKVHVNVPFNPITGQISQEKSRRCAEKVNIFTF